ncbi:MAG: PAS domain S-box protein [Bacteroidales bacterium]|nr:PAS domain S-box protein [Bacteroidales bacterium]
MTHIDYKKMMMSATFGVALHKTNLNKEGKPVDYTFLEANKAFESMTGLKASNIINKKVTEVLPGIENSDFNWIDFYGEVALTGKAKDFEQYSEPLKRWYKVYVYSPMREYFITIFTDTTREKLKFEEIDRFFSINLDLLCIADTDGSFIKVNKAWGEVLGYKPEDLEKKKFLSFVHPDDMQATLDALLELKANKPVLNFTNRYRTKDGSYRHIEWRSHPYGNLIYAAARDITERIEAETRLRETQKRLAAAQKFAMVGAWEYEINTGKLFWSKECEALFGLKEGEFEGTFGDFLKRVHPDDRKLVTETNQPITQYYEARPLEYEHRIIRKDGEVRWVRESAGAVKECFGKPKKIVGFVMDITRQKEAEQKLQKSETRYRGLIESQNDLIVRVDARNRFTFVNDAYCETFGKTRQELIGKSFTPLVHKDDLPGTLEAMKDLEKPPYRCQLAQRAMTKDGWRWIHWEDNAIVDGDGKILEIQGVGRDITELKKAEEKLKINEAKLKTLLAETPAVVYSYNFKNGVPDITYVNENVENILGFKPQHFLHDFETWASCVHPDDLKNNAHRFENMEEKLHAGQEEFFEYRFIDKQGKYHWLSDRQKVLADNDGKLFVIGVWIDITQDKKNREAIENEEKLRQIIENMDGVFWLRSADRQEMLYVSDAYEAIFGKTTESLKKNPASFMGIIHPDDKERVMASYNNFLETGTFNEEYRIIRPDDKQRWLHSKAFQVKNEEGETIRYAGFVTDISQQKKTSEQLRETSRRYKAVLKYSPLFVSEIDLSGRYLLVNEALADFIGKTAKEITGKTFSQVLNPETASLFMQRIKEVKATGQPITVEDQFETGNGTRYFSSVLFPLLGKSGKVASIGCISKDTTDVRLANAALTESEEKFRQISESMGEVFWLRSGDNTRMLYVNPAYEKVFGRSCESLYANPNSFLDAIHDADRPAVIEGFKIFEETGTFDMEYRIVRPDHEVKWLRAQTFPVYDNKGNIIRTTGVASDISKRKATELALSKSKEKAEESDRLKSAFLATVSHELRTPLNHILGFSDILRSASADKDITEYASIIHNSGRKFLSMIEDIFDLALTEQGAVKLREQTFRMADLFLESKSNLEELLSESGKNDSIRLRFKPDSSLLQSYVKSDKYKISQVLTNLFRNAVKFTHEGIIEFGCYRGENGNLIFYLNDTGIGIPQDKLDIIFDFFRQVDDSHTRHFEGLGIGLAISKKIAQTMYGELTVKSEEGKGSTFYFSVPAQFSNPDEGTTTYDNCPDKDTILLKEKTILVAEDDPDAMVIAAMFLSQAGASVIKAKNGAEAVDACKDNPDIDLVLMDLKMPVMDGFEATQKIKSLRPALPVVALTAYGLVKDKEKALAAGCDSILTKPYNRELLLCSLDKLLNIKDN